MYYTIELLRFMAPLHRAGLLHMAVDARHLLVRNDQEMAAFRLPLATR